MATRPAHAINRLENGEANNLNVLELVKSPAGSQSGDGLVVTLGANATGDGIQITHAGTGPSLNITSTNARGDIHFSNRASDPATTTEGDLWYNSTSNEFKFYNGTAVTTFGGSGSLDDAYNNGSTVTVDSGAVVLSADTVDTSDALTITREPASSAAAVGVSLTMGVNATGVGFRIDNNGSGNGIDLDHGGTGDGINVNLDGSSITQQAIVVGETAVARTASMMQLVRSSSAAGDVLVISNAGSQRGILINQNGASIGLDVIMGGSDTTSRAITITESAIARTVPLFDITRNAAASGACMRFSNSGSGDGLFVRQFGAANAVNITLETNTSAQGVVIVSSVATTTDLMSVTSSTTSATGVLLSLTKNPPANTSGNLVVITAGANTTGHALSISQSGSGDAINATGNVNITGKLTVSGLIDPTGIKMTEQASDPGSTGAGEGTYYVKNTVPSTPVFVDDTGAETTLGSGGVTDHASLTGVTANQHHNELHTIASHSDTTATGAELETLTGGGSTTLHSHSVAHSATTGKTANDHHNELHTIASHSDTTATGAELNELTDGSVTTLHSHAGGGGNTLDQAYDQGGAGAGRTITVSSGAVVFNQSGATNALEIDQSGAGDAVNVSLSSSTSAQALVVTESVAGTAAMVQLTRSTSASATGTCIQVTDNADNTAAAVTVSRAPTNIAGQDSVGYLATMGTDVLEAGAAFLANCQATVAPTSGFEVQNAGTQTWKVKQRGGMLTTLKDISESGWRVLETAAIAQPVIWIDRTNTSSSGECIRINNDGTSNGILINQSGAADAFNISLDSSTSAQAIVVTESAAVRTTAMVQLTRSSSASGDVIAMTAAGSGRALDISQSGTGDAINVALSNTSAQALVVTESVTATNPMIDITRNAQNTATGIEVNLNDLRTSYGTGIALRNTTASDATNTVQRSPQLVFEAHSWGTFGSSDDDAFWGISTTGVTSTFPYTNLEISQSLTGSTWGTPGLVLKGFAFSTAMAAMGIGTTPTEYLHISPNALSGTSSATGTVVYLEASGNCSFCAEDRTNGVEIAMEAESTVGKIGTLTSTNLELQTGGTSRWTVGSSVGDLVYSDTSTTASSRLKITRSPTSSSSGALIELTNTTNHTGFGVYAHMGGTGDVGYFWNNYVTDTGPALNVIHATNSGSGGVLQVSASSSSFTGNAVDIRCARAQSTLYHFFRCRSSTTSDTEFRLRGDGQAFADQNWNSGGADYAEHVIVNADKSTYAAGDVLMVYPGSSETFDKSNVANSTAVAGIVSDNPGFIGDHQGVYNVDPTTGTLESSNWNLIEQVRHDEPQGVYMQLEVNGDQTANYPAGSWLRIDSKVSEVKSSTYDSGSAKTTIDLDEYWNTYYDYTTASLYYGVQERNTVIMAMTGRVTCKCITENGTINPGDLLVTSSTVGHAMKASGSPGVGTVVGKALGTLADVDSTQTGSIMVYVQLM